MSSYQFCVQKQQILESSTKKAYGFDQGSGATRENGIQFIFALGLISTMKKVLKNGMQRFEIFYIPLCKQDIWSWNFTDRKSSHLKNYRPESMNAMVV